MDGRKPEGKRASSRSLLRVFLVSAMTGKRKKMRSIHLYRTLSSLSFSFFVRLEGGSSPVFRLLASLRGPTAALHRWGAWHRE